MQMVPSPQGMRIAPLLPAGFVQTYEISTPLATHFRPATCAEIECEAWKYGWATTVMPDSKDESAIKGSGRHWSAVEATPEGWRRYVFPGGQPCFQQGAIGHLETSRHRIRLDRPEIYVRRDGDWRGNPRGTTPYVHTRPEHWVEDFGTRQQQITDAINQG